MDLVREFTLWEREWQQRANDTGDPDRFGTMTARVTPPVYDFEEEVDGLESR